MRIKLTSIMVDDQADDIHGESGRLKGRGVVFTQEPTAMGPVTIAICADTCGNLIQLYQHT